MAGTYNLIRACTRIVQITDGAGWSTGAGLAMAHAGRCLARERGCRHTLSGRRVMPEAQVHHLATPWADSCPYNPNRLRPKDGWLATGIDTVCAKLRSVERFETYRTVCRNLIPIVPRGGGLMLTHLIKSTDSINTKMNHGPRAPIGAQISVNIFL